MKASFSLSFFHHGRFTVFFIALLVAVTLLPPGRAAAQIKINTGNLIGIRAEPQSGVSVNVSSNLTKFYYLSNHPFQIYNGAVDPRINSTNKVVFYNTANTSYINIEAGTVYEYSDAAAKENIRPLTDKSESPLAVISKLNGVTYQWKGSEDRSEQIGFVAQEVEQVLPQLVSTADSTGTKVMSYTHMVPYLVEAIKEQQTIIDGLRARLDRLDVVAAKEDDE